MGSWLCGLTYSTKDVMHFMPTLLVLSLYIPLRIVLYLLTCSFETLIVSIAQLPRAHQFHPSSSPRPHSKASETQDACSLCAQHSKPYSYSRAVVPLLPLLGVDS